MDATAHWPARPQGQTRSVLGLSWGEFLLVGGASLLLLPALWWWRQHADFASAELSVGFVMFHLAVVVNNPHFAVTYLLYYANARQRATAAHLPFTWRLRYWWAGVVVPLLLVSWAAVALAQHSAPALGALIQLMLLLVGWHYVKQGFGVVHVLCARRGVRWSQLERRVLLSHCFAAWFCAWSTPADAGKLTSVDGVLYHSLPHPQGLDVFASVTLALSSVALLWMLGRKLVRERAMSFLPPVVCFLITVWLWTVFSALDPLFMYVIPALHSLQYLYFVWLLKKNAAEAHAGPPHFHSVSRVLLLLGAGAVALGWLLFRGLPQLLDGTFVLLDDIDPLGPTPYLAAITAVVNIHHYFMDTVIWRRENPETRHLFA